ncbi:MAG: hypothetical protein ACI8XB_002571 [Patiriisocius sp.]|jgi:hypothetical protein
MKMAQANVSNALVGLLTTQYHEDREIIPGHMTILNDLKLEMSDYFNFKMHRKLPVIREIFNRLKDQEGDYCIYSNVDISVRPDFYQFVCEKVNLGYDAFVVNRRTIPPKFKDISEYDDMCMEVGEKHPGFDCFIFKKELLDKFEMGNAGLGANWIGRVIITNLIVHAKKFEIFEDEFKTFHIGDDRSWKNPDFADYDEFNRQELIKILIKYRLQFKGDTSKVSYLNEFLYKDMKWNEDGKNPYIASHDHQKPNILKRVWNKILSILR